MVPKRNPPTRTFGDKHAEDESSRRGHRRAGKEGITTAFGVPGAAINPFYSAMRKAGSISHVLARHVEGASHMAEGYTRAAAGNIGLCIGTSGPAGTDMITGLYSAGPTPFPSCA